MFSRSTELEALTFCSRSRRLAKEANVRPYPGSTKIGPRRLNFEQLLPQDKFSREGISEYLIFPVGVAGGTSIGDLEEYNGEGSIANLENDVDL